MSAKGVETEVVTSPNGGEFEGNTRRVQAKFALSIALGLLRSARSRAPKRIMRGLRADGRCSDCGGYVGRWYDGGGICFNCGSTYGVEGSRCTNLAELRELMEG